MLNSINNVGLMYVQLTEKRYEKRKKTEKERKIEREKDRKRKR